MNATKIVSGGSAGMGLAAALVYVLGRFSVNLTAEDGALIAAALVTGVAFVAHNGLVGCLRIVLHGAGQPAKPPAVDTPPPPAG